MASVVTENIILLIPTFFAIMIFTLVANAVVGNYSTQQTLIVIDGAQDQLISTISQLYFTINQPEIESCVLTKTIPLPEQIEGQNYYVTGFLQNSTLTLIFDFPGIPLTHSASVHLGSDAQWEESSIFSSDKAGSIISVNKYYDSTSGNYKIRMSFR